MSIDARLWGSKQEEEISWLTDEATGMGDRKWGGDI